MHWKYPAFALIVVLGNLTPLSSRAGGIVVSNLATPVLGYDTVQPIDPNLGGLALAQEFTTSSVSTTLVSIFANLGNYDVGLQGDFHLTAGLYASKNDLPDNSVLLTTFSFNVAAIPLVGFANVEFDPTSTVNLTPGTGYWFVLNGTSSDASGGTSWNYAIDGSHTGPGDLPNYSSSYDGGVTWNGPFPPAGVTNEPYLIQVNGGAVPEPASCTLGSIGLSALVALRRWSRSRRRVR
jgi:hypothetical protein